MVGAEDTMVNKTDLELAIVDKIKQTKKGLETTSAEGPVTFLINDERTSELYEKILRKLWN